MRLAKFISMSGVASRRKAELKIKSGDVKVNGKVITELSTIIDPSKDIVTVDNKKAEGLKEKAYFLLNKPIGYTSTCLDKYAKNTILELVPKLPGLHPVGRLDLNTSGLIIITNDGDFTYKLTHPKFEVEKEYHVLLTRNFKSSDIIRVENGILIEGKRTSRAIVKKLKGNWISLTIHEGRKRQIRKMMSLLHYHIKELKRVRIKGVKIGNLKSGEYRKLSDDEVNNLIKL